MTEDEKETNLILALNKEASQKVELDDLREMVEGLSLYIFFVEPNRDGLDKMRKQIDQLKQIKGFFEDELKWVFEDKRKQVVALIDPMIEEMQADVDFEDAETKKLIGSNDLRADYRETIKSFAFEVKDYLVERGVKDAHFWTAGVLIVIGKMPLRPLRISEEIKNHIMETPFEKLIRKDGGVGKRLRDYIWRLLK